jgi:hypothetical protein
MGLQRTAETKYALLHQFRGEFMKQCMSRNSRTYSDITSSLNENEAILYRFENNFIQK